MLALSEAANDEAEHQHFIDNHLGGVYTPVLGASRGRPEPRVLRPRSVRGRQRGRGRRLLHAVEHGRRRRRGHRALSLGSAAPSKRSSRSAGGGDAQRIRFVLVHAKSKGVFDVVDLAGYRNRALGNRKKLVAQAERLRERLDGPLRRRRRPPDDSARGHERRPRSRRARASARAQLRRGGHGVGVPSPPGSCTTRCSRSPRTTRWTADFPDPIVSHPMGWNHRVWIDHILLSPDMMEPTAPLRFVAGAAARSTSATRRRAWPRTTFAVSCAHRGTSRSTGGTPRRHLPGAPVI